MSKAKGKKKGAKARRLTKAKSKAAALAPPESGASDAAAHYLQQWALMKAATQQHLDDDASSAWKFNKNRQTFLLRSWPSREKINADTFKHLLLYVRTLPVACAERTAAHAREVAKKCEADEQTLLEQESAQAGAASGDGGGDDDGDEAADGAAASAEAREEQRAVLKIQRARALRLLKVLVEPGDDDAE